MIKREEQKDPKKRILSVCVKMFIEKGFKETTMLDIIREADVAAGTFQNIFRTKDGVLSALTEFMFKNQFGIARGMSENVENPAFVYAAETAIQLAITELNENIREIYIEVYTQHTYGKYIGLFQYLSQMEMDRRFHSRILQGAKETTRGMDLYWM